MAPKKIETLASPHLTGLVFDMMKQLGKKAECPICFNDAMACPQGGCFALRNCGHICCLRCHVRTSSRCPICRTV